VKRLAKALSVTTDAILGKPKPFDLFGISRDVPDDRTYFGEAAFHFAGSGAPILVPISEATRDSLLRQVENRRRFLFAESLDNRTLFVRLDAVGDMYFSSEAYDTFGPEPDAYDDHLGVRPDDAYWLLIEHVECPECLGDSFTQEEIENVLGRIAWSDFVADRLIASGQLAETDREDAKAEAEALVTRATCVTWQLTRGLRRVERPDEDSVLYDAFVQLRDFDEMIDGPIYFPAEGYHRSVFINPTAVDFIAVPTHRFKNGELGVLEEELG
jgi:hypothetical protein